MIGVKSILDLWWQLAGIFAGGMLGFLVLAACVIGYRGSVSEVEAPETGEPTAVETAMKAFDGMLAPLFEGYDEDVTEENIQARIRGVVLMALSNKFGSIVVTTGNKSEMATGYCTLYGDMAGGFAVIKDVPKQLVYDLTRRRNERAGRELVPASVIERAPSAELRPDQRDEDSLPPYEELDQVLEAYVELDRSREELLAEGFDAETVERALALIDRAEYKRRQAPPGVKITRRAFGRDRRYPITNAFKGPV